MRRLLGGATLDTADLAYDLDGWHLGVIATGADATHTVGDLAAQLDCRLLSVSHSEHSVWAWLGARRRLASTDVDRAIPDAASAQVTLAIGEPAKGLEGWRLGHRQAQTALLVALRRPTARRLTRYADVALLALALRDDMLTRSLVQIYLSRHSVGSVTAGGGPRDAAQLSRRRVQRLLSGSRAGSRPTHSRKPPARAVRSKTSAVRCTRAWPSSRWLCAWTSSAAPATTKSRSHSRRAPQRAEYPSSLRGSGTSVGRCGRPRAPRLATMAWREPALGWDAHKRNTDGTMGSGQAHPLAKTAAPSRSYGKGIDADVKQALRGARASFGGCRICGNTGGGPGRTGMVCMSKVTAKTGKFTKINCGTEKAESNFAKVKVGEFPGVTVTSKNVLGKNAVLKATNLGMTCTTINDKSQLWNEEVEGGVVGRGFSVLKLSGCTASGALAGCTVAEPMRFRVQTALIEEGGKIYNVYSPISATWTLTPSPPCPGTSTVTGIMRGEIPVGAVKSRNSTRAKKRSNSSVKKPNSKEKPNRKAWRAKVSSSNSPRAQIHTATHQRSHSVVAPRRAQGEAADVLAKGGRGRGRRQATATRFLPQQLLGSGTSVGRCGRPQAPRLATMA